MGQEQKEYAWKLISKKLCGEASPQELRELEMLLKNNPDLHYPMQTIADLWNHTNRQDQQDAEQAFSRHLERMKGLTIDFPSSADQEEAPGQEYLTADADVVAAGNKPAWSRRRKILLASSVFCMLAMLIIWRYPQWNPKPVSSVIGATARISSPANNEIYTSNGSRTHVTLPDGTLVWLNAGSRIVYGKNYGTDSREVNLTGEAFFDVARDANKPFIIHTTRIDIKVLGTSFNVKSYPTDQTTEATLIRGSIEVSIRNRPSDKITLKPNEKLVVINEDSSLNTLHKVIPGIPGRHSAAADESPLVSIRKPTLEAATGAIIETSWVNNKLIFQDEEFSALARQMERWYGVSIKFNNPASEELRFTGTFQHETIEQALKALRLTADFQYSIEGNQVVIR